jgi:hypothetical protein
VPDDIQGLPSTLGSLDGHLASKKDAILYEAETDHGKAFRCYRGVMLCLFTPWGVTWLLTKSISQVCRYCSCDEACCWLRKEYSTRTYFRIYANHIEVNEPSVRFPFGYFGCGSWNSDTVVAHPFDRGAFGFQHVRTGSWSYLCCCWPVYGGAVARHRCQCNGPLWNRMFTDCGGWWCDEWPCQMCFCVYRYSGLAYPDEAAFAASIALQAYFEGRTITPEDMVMCIEYWRKNVSERVDPTGKKRSVCCEPYYVPSPGCTRCYKCLHPKRSIPYGEDKTTDQVREVYDKYEVERLKQIETYDNYYGPMQHSTICQTYGCRRFFGRKGFCFCTEGCASCDRKTGEPAPPFVEHYFDDDYDASSVLLSVIGPPPANVVVRRWRWDPEKGEQFLEFYPPPEDSTTVSDHVHES